MYVDVYVLTETLCLTELDSSSTEPSPQYGFFFVEVSFSKSPAKINSGEFSTMINS